MGYATIVQVLNDGMDQLKKHPEEFSEAVLNNYYDGGTGGVGNHANCVQVIKSQHADTFQLVGSHRNLALALSRWDRETMELAERRPDIIHEMIERARRQLDDLERELPEEGT